MSKIAAAVFLLSALLAAAPPLASQTRPRRVLQTEEAGYSESQPRAAASRPRTAGAVPAREGGRRGGRRWAGTLLRVGMTAAVIGVAGRGGGCTPGRDNILGRVPR